MLDASPAQHERHEPDAESRAGLPEVQPLPLSRARVGEQPALYLGSLSWIVCGLAAVVLGVIAVVGVTHAFALDKAAILICAAVIVASGVSGQLRRRGDA
jgi:hypothetical protein